MSPFYGRSENFPMAINSNHKAFCWIQRIRRHSATGLSMATCEIRRLISLCEGPGKQSSSFTEFIFLVFSNIALTNSLLVQVFDSSAITLICILLEKQANGAAARFLPRACGLLRDSCGNPELSRRDADDPLAVPSIPSCSLPRTGQTAESCAVPRSV